MNAIIWSYADCESCRKAKELLLSHGVEIEERNADRLIERQDMLDRDARTELDDFQNGKLPVVFIDVSFVHPKNLEMMFRRRATK